MIESSDNNLKPSSKYVDYEEALNRTGIGKFNYLLLIVCSIGMLSNGIQNGITAYLLPSVKCEFKMTSAQVANVNISFMFGGITSACLWGIIADIKGKRYTLIITFLVDSLTMLIGSFSQSYLFLLIVRFLSGFFIGGPGCLIFSYLADFMPVKIRAKYLCCIGFCFILSWVILPALALIVIPIEQLHIVHLNFDSWRLYMMLMVLPSLITTMLMIKLPESPKYYLMKGQKEECLTVLQIMFRMNAREVSTNYDVNIESLYVDNLSCKDEKSINYVKNTFEHIKTLFSHTYIYKTFIMMFVTAANMFGCYGFGLWIPEIMSQHYNAQQTFPNISISVCDWKEESRHTLIHQILNETFLEYPKSHHAIEEGTCKRTLAIQTYIDTILIGVACLCGNFTCTLLSQHLKAKKLLTILLIIAGLTAISFVSFGSSSMSLVILSIFQSATITGNIVIATVVMEIFPMRISSMAICVTTLAGRLGAIISNTAFGLLSDISCRYPIYLVAILSIGGAIALMFIKKDPKPLKNDDESAEYKREDIIDYDFGITNI